MTNSLTTNDFRLVVECDLYTVRENSSNLENSSVRPGEFQGLLSLSSEDIIEDLSKQEVFDLLDSAHAEKTLIRQFIRLHHQKSESLRPMGFPRGGLPTIWVDPDDAHISGSVSDSLLRELIEFDGGVRMVRGLARYDTRIDHNAAAVETELMRQEGFI